MNPKQLVKLSNIVGVISITLLIYWVFIFITIEVFELKIFRKNLTNTFYLSILGILALMSGALMVNIMFNLTRIAERLSDEEIVSKRGKKIVWVFLISLPIIFLGLFAGDYLTSKKKEQLLLESAESIVESNKKKKDHLLNYKFDEAWIVQTEEFLEIISKTDKDFSRISILVKDSINDDPVFLAFTENYNGTLNDTIQPEKRRFIRETTKPEREYLNAIFDGENKEYRYSSADGVYELFYPYRKEGKKIVIYFSQYRRYGKIGS